MKPDIIVELICSLLFIDAYREKYEVNDDPKDKYYAQYKNVNEVITTN